VQEFHVVTVTPVLCVRYPSVNLGSGRFTSGKRRPYPSGRGGCFVAEDYLDVTAKDKLSSLLAIQSGHRDRNLSLLTEFSGID
jgi:hypothetical protein